jgi:hypothetical protein
MRVYLIMDKKEPFDIRVILKEDDELYSIFLQAKQILGLRNNTEITRVLIKKGFEWLKKADALISPDSK